MQAKGGGGSKGGGTVVTKSGQAGWYTFTQCYGAGGNPTVSFVTGPATPPAGTGSLQLATGDGTTGGDCQSALRNINYAGVPVASLTTLSYWTYMQKNNGQQFPTLTLDINYSGTGTNVDDVMFFEPPYQTPSAGSSSCPDQGAALMSTWQTWNALTGCWWSNTGNFGNPGAGGVAPLSTLLATYPNATIVNPASKVGGVRVFVGEASPTDQFLGNVDLFQIGVNGAVASYNFEAPQH